MKRFLSALLCAVLVLGLTVTGIAADISFSAGAVSEITLSADAAYVNTTSTTDAAAIKALNTLLASAKTTVRLPSGAEEVAKIQAKSADQTRTFTLSRGGADYILSLGGSHRSVSYSVFNNFVNAIGSDKVYKYRAISEQIYENGSYCLLSVANFKYLRLSGQFTTYETSHEYEPPGYVQSNGKLYIPTFSQPYDSSNVKVSGVGETLWEGTLRQAGSYRLSEPGEYYVTITLRYNNAYAEGEMEYFYRINYDEEQQGIAFSVEGDDTYLGEAVVLRVTGTTASDPLATFASNISLNLPPKFHRMADGSQVALFPVSYRNAAGNHWIEIKCGDASARFTVSAKDKKWQIQNLTVDSTTASETINSQKANDEYERVIAPLRSVEDDTRHWSGRFILPASDHRVTTEFGMVRYVNGEPTSTRHGAIDLANPTGTEVKATGAGRVLYAGYLQLTGNTVLIEHGYGLKSWYYHMNSLNVKTGDMVAQGKKIGEVGSTGFSTGPHLHFGMSVNNVFINPYTAINTDLFANVG